MALHEKPISEISPGEVKNLVKEGVPEDAFLEFREVLVDPRWPQDKVDKEQESFVGDLVAFANFEGGLLIIGIEANEQERAKGFVPFPGDQAKKIAKSARDLAIQHVEPPIVPLEVRDFALGEEDWIVIARVPASEAKPHRTKYKDRPKRFMIRDQDRKREMTYDEIMKMFQQGPQQGALAQILARLESVQSELEALRARIET